MMIKPEITTLIGRAVREGKYLSITYLNQSGSITPFWISILDIKPNGELKVNQFNVTKDSPLLDAKIFLAKIQTAEILKFSYCEVNKQLVKKLDEDAGLQEYGFDGYNNILNYYLECYKANFDPFLHKQHLIPGLDLNELENKNPYPLTNEQLSHIIKHIYHDDYNSFYNYNLAFSLFSIDTEAKGKFVVAYRNITLDPVAKTLQIGSKTHFNAGFYIKGVKYTLSYYTDMSPADFESQFLNNKAETVESLIRNFKTGELPNTRPEIVVLGYSQIDISKIYEGIQEEYQSNTLQIPLKAFFQKASQEDRKSRKEPNIVLYDRNVNLDQLRTIYNALKYPITYVQGPPGTGKTQTLLNIAINCLINNKTLLISSNNNTPVDGILEKLVLKNYIKKDIMLPIIRLGNKEATAEALKKMKAWYEFETKDNPKEALLTNIKERSKKNNKDLRDKLKIHETKLELEQNLEFINTLLSKGKYDQIEMEKLHLEKKLNELPETTDSIAASIFEVIKDNHTLLQYFYFESLKHVKRLKNKDYKPLIDILYIEEKDEQIKAFNSWIGNDSNLVKFTKVFPIILSTNLSSRNLGKNFKFDLLAMDEAGQCDIATGLIPISKCKNMVLIGDTNQLKPIVVFEESKNKQLKAQFKVDYQYDYFNNSILSVYKNIDNISMEILLSYHYRCGRKIINFSNQRYYNNALKPSEKNGDGEVKLVKTTNLNTKGKNSSFEEARAIINYIQSNNLKDVFIITPFRNQEELINQYLKDGIKNGIIDSSVACGTIHKIQGQENKTIIISTAISTQTSPKTYDWIKNNSQLINVAVTRAKENLIVFTDKDAIDCFSRKDDDLYALINYVEDNGTTEIPKSTYNKFTIGYSNNSKFEDEFYKTMMHYCSIQGSTFRRNVKVIDVFPEEKDNASVNSKEFDAVLYNGNVVLMVFEVNGPDHIYKKPRIKSDKQKTELCHSKNIPLLQIPNNYVKHYRFIINLIDKYNGIIYQKTLFDPQEEVKKA